MPEEMVTAAEAGSCTSGPSGAPCPSCRKRSGEADAVRDGTVHPYSHVPRGGWQARYATGETPGSPTFGIEWETSLRSDYIADLPGRPTSPYRPWDADEAAMVAYRTARAAIAAFDARNAAHRERVMRAHGTWNALTVSEAAALFTDAMPRGMFTPTHDGSISCVEAKSQPASLAYWRQHRPSIARLATALRHGGVTSHDGEECGMHINVGRDAFTSALHVARFLTLVACNPRWATALSGRTHAQVSAWASFARLADADRRSRLADEWWADGSAYTGHSSAVNLEHGGRVEFRLPRGTVRTDRLYQRLEWVASMVEYTSDAGNGSASDPTAYVLWTLASGRYPEAVALFREICPLRLEATRTALSPEQRAERRAARRARRAAAPADVAPVACLATHDGSMSAWPCTCSPRRPLTPAALETAERTWPSDGQYVLTSHPCGTCGDSWGSHRGIRCPDLCGTFPVPERAVAA